MNTLALARSGSISSMTGRAYVSRCRALFNCFGSWHILSSPDSLVATTRLLTHSVSSSTGTKTCSPVSLSNSDFSLDLTANATLQDGEISGVTVGSTFNVCCPSNLPTSPSKTSLNSLFSWSAVFRSMLVDEMPRGFVVVVHAICDCTKFSL